MASKFCTTCGAPLEGRKFCTSCGAPAEAESSAEAPVSAEPTAPEPAPAPAPTPAPAPAAVAVAEAAPAPAPAPAPVSAPSATAQTESPPPAGSKYAPVSLGGWIGIMLLLMLPLVNVVLLIVWACGGCKKVNKRNFARASLILMVVCLILSVIAGVVIKLTFDSFMKAAGLDSSAWSSIGALISGDDSAFSSSSSSSSGSGFDYEDFLSRAQQSGGSEDYSEEDGYEDGYEEEFFESTESTPGYEEEYDSEGLTQEEKDLLNAVLTGDRDALRRQGYSEEEIDQAIAVFGGTGLGALLGGFS
ncbi:MAG: zinc ribbon domain-containing protein [Oscillospiraceae bacterium]|nr:zinc ribbon domain-containing protein [Oscillospiraceae bacterium]